MIKLRPILPLLALAALGLTARASDRETATIKFSDPAKPGTIRVTIATGDLRIHGADTGEVIVSSELQSAKTAARKDGMRVLSSTTSYELSEKDNVVTLNYGLNVWGGNGNGDFDITVPRNTNVIVASSFGGDTVIGNVTGDIEVKNLNGEVKLQDVTGGALVETMNGEVNVTVSGELHEGKPLSFSSMNGEVTVNLPASLKANVKLRTHNGAILTDFDEKALVTKTESLGGRRDKSLRLAYGVDTAQIQSSVREAVRAGMEVARAATEAARDAARQAARESGNGDDDDHDNDSDDVAPAAPVAPMAPVPPLPPMTGGKIVTGTLNGGGPEIRVTTMNGDVKLRRIDGKDAK